MRTGDGSPNVPGRSNTDVTRDNYHSALCHLEHPVLHRPMCKCSRKLHESTQTRQYKIIFGRRVNSVSFWNKALMSSLMSVHWFYFYESSAENLFFNPYEASGIFISIDFTFLCSLTHHSSLRLIQIIKEARDRKLYHVERQWFVWRLQMCFLSNSCEVQFVSSKSCVAADMFANWNWNEIEMFR